MVKDGIYLSGRYQVLSKIGAGGMADVYKAKDCMLNRYVAVKVLKKEYREDENFVKKFRSEAQAAAGLLNPNIVNVYDVGEDRGLYYMVMELVEGITLKEYVHKKGKLSSCRSSSGRKGFRRTGGSDGRKGCPGTGGSCYFPQN